jgi:hypothetical protein
MSETIKIKFLTTDETEKREIIEFIKSWESYLKSFKWKKEEEIKGQELENMNQDYVLVIKDGSKNAELYKADRLVAKVRLP